MFFLGLILFIHVLLYLSGAIWKSTAKAILNNNVTFFCETRDLNIHVSLTLQWFKMFSYTICVFHCIQFTLITFSCLHLVLNTLYVITIS